VTLLAELERGRVVLEMGGEQIAPACWWIVLDAAGRTTGIAWTAQVSGELDSGPPGHAVEGALDETPDGHASIATADGYQVLIRPLRRDDPPELRAARTVSEETARDTILWWLPKLKGRLRLPG
jgi:hypothetical protein